ncbi:hypothetical protein [Catelliglobosispora koreensis]|uniref:hypothetical protein n=1 Tax=Catelliglobosispora koreensis TaxID=129052 RepID=UPI00037B4D45|nr:hypothetical protein [Catelliglobosispora koreensis]
MRELLLIDHQAHVDRVWWNGNVKPGHCVYLRLGRLPDGDWFVQSGDRAVAFDHEDDALAVARQMTLGWIAIPVSFTPDRAYASVAA